MRARKRRCYMRKRIKESKILGRKGERERGEDEEWDEMEKREET
jgi:hypothetical protein